MEVTKREIIASITIVSILLLIGMLLSSVISEKNMDTNEKYNKALKIESKDQFEYGMNTNVGNAFVYGELAAVDAVSYPDINGKYLYIEKIKEKYTMHTKSVTTTVNGKTETRTETYWTWDKVSSEKLLSKKVTFLGVEFNSSQFNIPSGDYIDTIKESPNTRYKYYGYPMKSKVTIFTYLKNKNIEQEDVHIYKDMTIAQTVDSLENGIGLLVGFWILWIILISCTVYGFCYLDNKWLYK